MMEHTHCWHAVTNTPAGETPYAQQCCWCGQWLYKAPGGETVAHGPYTAEGSQHTVHMEFDETGWQRFNMPSLREALR